LFEKRKKKKRADRHLHKGMAKAAKPSSHQAKLQGHGWMSRAVV